VASTAVRLTSRGTTNCQVPHATSVGRARVQPISPSFCTTAVMIGPVAKAASHFIGVRPPGPYRASLHVVGTNASGSKRVATNSAEGGGCAHVGSVDERRAVARTIEVRHGVQAPEPTATLLSDGDTGSLELGVALLCDVEA
jgi:hypothetical protein